MAGRLSGARGLAAALERLVGKQPEQRHHDRRHSAAAVANARLALSARAILHSIEDVEQSHSCLLNSGSQAKRARHAGHMQTSGEMFQLERRARATRAGIGGNAGIAENASNRESVPHEQHDNRMPLGNRIRKAVHLFALASPLASDRLCWVLSACKRMPNSGYSSPC